MVRRLLLASLLLAWSVLVSAQAPPQEPDRLERLRVWLEAVEHHQPGETDAGLIVAQTLSSEDMEELWRDLHGFLGILGFRNIDAVRSAVQGMRPMSSFKVPYPPSYSRAERETLSELARLVLERGGGNRLIKRAAVLHADVLLLTTALPEGSWERTSTLRSGLVLDMTDGGSRGFNRFAPHLEFGRTLLELVRPSPSSDPMVRLWYLATIAAWHGEQRLDVPHVSRAVQLFPEDADILLQAGCLHEWLATVTVQLSLEAVRLPLPAIQVGSSRVELTRARRLFERATGANKNLAEARIRLGRVLQLQGHHPEAVAQLQQGLQSPADPVIRYYGHLFLGGSLEALRDLPGARTAYRAAVTLFPRAQSAQLALARVAAASGDGQEELQRVEAILSLPADSERHDPWWTYHMSAGRVARMLLTRLRQQTGSLDRH